MVMGRKSTALAIRRPDHARCATLGKSGSSLFRLRRTVSPVSVLKIDPVMGQQVAGSVPGQEVVATACFPKPRIPYETVVSGSELVSVFFLIDSFL